MKACAARCPKHEEKVKNVHYYSPFFMVETKNILLSPSFLKNESKQKPTQTFNKNSRTVIFALFLGAFHCTLFFKFFKHHSFLGQSDWCLKIDPRPSNHGAQLFPVPHKEARVKWCLFSPFCGGPQNHQFHILTGNFSGGACGKKLE